MEDTLVQPWIKLRLMHRPLLNGKLTCLNLMAATPTPLTRSRVRDNVENREGEGKEADKQRQYKGGKNEKSVSTDNVAETIFDYHLI